MEIKSYIKHIPQKPITPPPLEQKRITLDLSFEQFLLILASVGVAQNLEVQNYLNENAPTFKHVKPYAAGYSVYSQLLEHAQAAQIVKR